MSNEVALALIRHMVRSGVLDARDIGDIADELAADGHLAQSMAVNCAFLLESNTNTRPVLRIVPDIVGGND